jgi:hypothetical protein
MTALNYVTLTGTMPGADITTQVTFTPAEWVAQPGELLIPPVPVQTFCNSGGEFSVSLLATDNALTPSTWYWTVEITGIPDVVPESWSFYLLYADGATQDISSLAEIIPAANMAAYLLLAGGQMEGALGLAVGQLTDGPTITIPTAAGNQFRITIAGNRVLEPPAGLYDGQKIQIDVTQGTTGGWTLSFASGFDLGDLTVAWSTTPGVEDSLLIQYKQSAGTWKVLAFAPGY